MPISSARGLHRLIYASQHNIRPADLDHELGGIVRASIRNNRQVAVTGLLLAYGEHFLQALEGPAQAVMITFGRICRDRRHTDAKVLTAGPIQARAFADWNMCARRMSDADDAILDTLSLRGGLDPMTLDARSALRLLEAVRNIQDRTQLDAMV